MRRNRVAFFLLGALVASGVWALLAHREPEDAEAREKARLAERDRSASMANRGAGVGDGAQSGATSEKGAAPVERDIASLREQLAKNESDKKALEARLAVSEAMLARHGDGGAASPSKPKDAFDLSKDDWAKLAEKAQLKYRLPCTRFPGWKPSAEALQSVGLDPGDANLLADVTARSEERLAAVLKPMCAQSLGSAAVADRIWRNRRVGKVTCTTLALEDAMEQDPAGTIEAMRRVGEIRAGLRPAPVDASALSRIEQMFLALTGETAAYEADLASKLGPDEARRLMHEEQPDAKAICLYGETYTGPAQREWAGK